MTEEIDGMIDDIVKDKVRSIGESINKSPDCPHSYTTNDVKAHVTGDGYLSISFREEVNEGHYEWQGGSISISYCPFCGKEV